VRVEVEDSGLGIRAEDIERIFGMFQRIGDNNEIEGAGIGLALCKRIAERHRGRVGVRSDFGKGSVFWAELPEVPAG